MEADNFRGPIARLQYPPPTLPRFGFPYTGKAGFRLLGRLCRTGFGPSACTRWVPSANFSRPFFLY